MTKAPNAHARPAGPDPDALRRPGLWTLVAGLALLAGAVALAAARAPAGRIFFYHLAWAGTLTAMAGGLALRTGRWPLDAPAAVSLFFWSAPVWYLYELVNFRIENWYYVFVAPEAPVRWIGTFLAFSTVLPALYLAYRWMRELGLAEGWSRPRFEVRGVHRAAAAALGVAFAVLALWRPRAFYPLVWGAVTLLVEPWNHRRDPSTSLLGDLSRGSWTRIARLLAGGLLIGLLWELYNFMAAARWIYTVPGLEDGKLFEMPVPGFLGFPVLALDGYVVYRALEGLGVALPAWGEGDAPAGREPGGDGGRAVGDDGGPRSAVSPRAAERPSRARADGRDEGRAAFRPGRAAAAALGALAFCAAVQAGVDRWTLDSVYPALEEVPGVTAGVADGLRDAGVADVEALAAADSAEVAGGSGLPPGAAGPAVRGARLTVMRGMGAENAGALWDAGIRSVCELAEADEGRVSAVVRAARDAPNAGKPARVRVWLRAARDRCGAGSGGRRRARSGGRPARDAPIRGGRALREPRERSQTMDEQTRERSVEYATELYARKSDTQRWILEQLGERGLPSVQISALEGRILAVLARSVDARRLLEVGTLGGYSALWLLSLLEGHARLVTVEKDPDAAALAREAFRRAGEEDRVELREEDGHEALRRLPGSPSFDFVFVDADKSGYPRYLEAAASLMRPGGILAADNTFWEGKAADPPAEEDDSTRGIRAFNRTLAEDPRFEAVIVPVRDGLTVARFVG